MKFHIRDIYYYLDNNRYLAHQLSEITIEKLRNIFIDNQLTLFDEKKIKKKLYEKYTYIFKKNNSKLNEDKNLQNKITIQCIEYIKENIFIFSHDQLKLYTFQEVENTSTLLSSKQLKQIKDYFDSHKNIYKKVSYTIGPQFFVSYFLSENVNKIVDKVDLMYILYVICKRNKINYL